MRIGILTDYEAVNSEYRSFPLLELAKRGHDVRLAPDRRDLDLATLRSLDVLHVYRYRDERMWRLARDLRAHGVGIVWDSDDDHTKGARGMPTGQRAGAMRAQHSQREIMRMMEVAHLVTVTTSALADLYRSWGGSEVEVEVVDNYLPPNYGVPMRSRPRDGKVVVGWPAASEHRYDARELGIRNVAARLLKAHPELRVVTIGLDLDLSHERYEHRSVVQYTDLGGHLADFDVGIAPIADIAFNRMRSRVKVKEYAGARLPWLASPIGPYAGLGENEGGRLVGDDAWEAELTRLIRSAKDRRKLAKKSAKWAQGQTIVANLDRIERPLLRAAAIARTQRTEAVI